MGGTETTSDQELRRNTMTATSLQQSQPGAVRGDESYLTLDVLARRRIAENCSYAFYFRDVTFHSNRGVLTLRGRVPTCCLKQMLQTLLKGLEGVTQIVNHVEVVNSRGLSSARPK